jgi:hypothetical protein
VGKDTTRATGPLREDGTVDYVFALNQRMSEGVTPENNATVAILRVFGPKAFRYEPLRMKRLWSELRIDPLPDEGDYFVTPDGFAAQNAGPNDDLEAVKEKQGEFFTRACTDEDAPLLAKWLKSQNAHIDQIAAAARLPKMYTPLLPSNDSVVMTSILGNGLYVDRSAANALTCRAGHRLAAGDLEGFRSDVDACVKLSKLVRQRPILVDHLVAFGIDAVATATVCNAATSEKLTAAQAKTLLSDLDKIEPLPAPSEAIDLGERYLLLDFFTLGAREGWVKAAKTLAGEKTDRMLFTGKQNRDWDSVLKRINKRYDRMVSAMEKPTYAQRRTSMREYDEDLEKERARVGGALAFLMPVEDRMLMILTPSLSRTVDVAERAVIERDLARVALALAMHKADKSAYPEKLESLVPAYLPSIPNDGFAAEMRPFNYERNPLGGYRLTSVGSNREDERDRLDQNYSADDVVIKAGKQPQPPKPEVEELDPDNAAPGDPL